MGVRLFVGNLDYSVNEGDLRAHFSEVGAPAQVALPVDRDTGRPRGFAFVEFAERELAEEVIRRFNGQPLKGRPLAISEARAREDRPPMGSGPRPPRPSFGGGPPGAPSPRPPREFPSDAPRGGPSGPSRERRPAKGKAKQQERGGPERSDPRASERPCDGHRGHGRFRHRRDRFRRSGDEPRRRSDEDKDES